MANYYATTRSNYFRVLDPDTFKTWCNDRSLEVWDKDIAGDTFYAISADTGDSSGWPSQTLETDENGDEDFVDIDFDGELAEQLDPRDIAVLMEVGYEKLRYLVGVAVAIHPDGRKHIININSITDEAKALFGDSMNITEAHY